MSLPQAVIITPFDFSTEVCGWIPMWKNGSLIKELSESPLEIKCDILTVWVSDPFHYLIYNQYDV